MTRHLISGRLSAATMLVAAGSLSLTLGCTSVTDSLLTAKDPDIILPGSFQSAEGAQALYIGALGRLKTSTVSTSGLQEPEFLFSGLLADEWSTSSTFVQNDEVDQRKIQLNNSSVRDQFRELARVRTATNQAIASLKEFRPTESAKIAEMYFARGFVEAQLAQDFCNGIPLSDGTGAYEDFVLGEPLTVAEVFARAIASYDSALALATGTDAASVDINRATRIAKARALLGLDRFAEASALVPAASVPTSYSYDVTQSSGGGSNAIWGQGASSRRYTVSDSLEGNARDILVKNVIPFFSAKDPRLPVKYTVSSKGDTTKSQDGFTFSRTTTLWGQFTSVPLVNGIDARLIEAEAKLRGNDYPGMIQILNTLRSAGLKIGEIQLKTTDLPPLLVPTTPAQAETMYFREKAFWTFSRGQRLGDLRRLIRFYPGHTPENTFPVGEHYRGGNYGTDVNLPVPTDELTNPNFTGCIDRKA
jgi:starch-binding outer membrane protein, SusD/RagB family